MSIKYYDKSGATPEEKLLAGISPVDAILSPTSKNAIQNKAVYNALRDKLEAATTDLINYYLKSDVYNKSEVRALIGAVETLTMEVVSSLPVSDISTTTIYLLKPTGSNVYDEYVYINDAWVKIGTTELDLSGYMLTADFNVAIADYFTKAEINNMLNSYYTKAEINTDFYDKDAVDDLLDAKQDTLTFDSTPTAESSNPVTSDGTYDALATKANQTEVNDIVNFYGAKNVLPVSSVTQTSFNGVTITNYKDGTYLLNGTCTADASFSIHSVTESDFLAKIGLTNYILNGYPSISGNTGRIVFQYRKADDSGWAEGYYDNGQGVTIPYDGTKKKYTIYLLIKAGDSFSNVTFKPMLRIASDPNPSYQPYAMTNRELTRLYKNVSFPGTSVVLDDITTLVNLFVDEDDATYYGNFIRVGKNAGYYTLTKYADSVNSFIVGIIVTGTLGYLIHWVNGTLSVNELLKRTSVTKTSVAPFRVYKNGRTANVSTIDGSSVSDISLQAATWATQVRDLGIIDSTMGTDYVMAPVMYQVGNNWHTGVARIFYTGRVDLWSPVAITGTFIPYLNVTLVVT